MRLPEINEHVLVHVEGEDAALDSRVEDMVGDSIAIGIPSDGQVAHALPAGTAVTLEWLTPRGIASIPARVGKRANLNVPVLLVEPAGKAVITQRREFVRAEETIPVVVRLPDGDVDAWTFDVSGGGARVWLPVALEPDSYARIRLALSDGPVDVLARVVRCDDEETVALVFVEIHPADRERIIALAFESHRRAHAMLRRP